MRGLHGDHVDIAHEQVFGYRPARSSTATDLAPASQRPQPPPTTPPLRARPPHRLVRDSARSLVPRQPEERKRMFAGVLRQRQVPGKRISLSSRGPGTECTAATVWQQYYGVADPGPGPQAPLDYEGYISPIPATSNSVSSVAKTVSTFAQAKVSEPPQSTSSLVITSALHTNPYYYRFQTASPSAEEQTDSDAAPMPPLGPGCNAVESSSLNARAYWQPQATNSPSLRTGPSAGTAAASTVTTTATVYRSGSATVFERLAGESSIGISMIGKRVRQWAEGAGLMLHPSNSVWHALLTYSMAPLKYERLWRRTCAKGRYRLSLLTRPKVCNGTSSAAALREHNIAEERSHADPHQKATNLGQRSRARRHSIPSTTPGGLSAYRVQQEYMRWCQWQLWHFFEQGSSYLTSVWRVSPLLWRQRRHAARCCGGKESTATSPASSVSLIFDGRYTVPSVASIDAAQEEQRTLEKRVKVLLRLLRRENGSSAPASTTRSCSRDNGSNGAATAAHRADDIAASDPDGEGEEDWEEENVYRSANQTRHRSEAVAVTQPFLDVHIDEATALMHLSLYINGDANGNGAEFVGSSVAGCIDNHRWVILKGLWARQVLVFCFYRGEGLPSTTKKQVDGHLKRQGGYDEQTEQDVSRCSHIVEGLVVKGVAFTKMHPGHTLATAQDTFACTRCGHKRRCHNVAYTSKQTGRIVCGVYYCVVCLTRTHHVCIPPMKDLPTVLLGGSEAGAVEGSRVHQLRGLSSVRSSASFSRSTNTTGSGLLPSAYAHWCSGSGSHAADASQFSVEDAATAMREWTRAAAAAPRPAWLLGSKVNSDKLFGRTRGLDCPPPRPRV